MARGSRGGGRPSGSGFRGYTLRGRNGKINYVGTTNNPGRRAGEHKSNGKTGRLQTETGLCRGERQSGGKPTGSRRTGTITVERTHPTTGPRVGKQYRAAGISVKSPCLCER